MHPLNPSNLKIKETPIDDTQGAEQFNVGDKIRAYTENHRPRIETIGDIQEDHLVTIDGGHIHYKCCRKIEYSLPRDFWVDKYSNQYTEEKPHTLKDWIHVREVLDDN